MAVKPDLRQSLCQRILALVRGLPDLDRQAFTLWHYSGLAAPEIASRLALPRPVVEQALRRARRQLAEGLRPFLRQH